MKYSQSNSQTHILVEDFADWYLEALRAGFDPKILRIVNLSSKGGDPPVDVHPQQLYQLCNLAMLLVLFDFREEFREEFLPTVVVVL